MPLYVKCCYPHREVIQCSDHTQCDKCGWDPAVERQRKEEGFESQKLTDEERETIMNGLIEKWKNDEDSDEQGGEDDGAG